MAERWVWGPRWRIAGAVVASFALVAGGCEAGGTGDVAQEAAPATDAPEAAADEATGLITGTPPGGLRDWVADIGSGLEGVAALTETAPDSALGRVINLYATRQEYIELYYGPNGRFAAGPPLGPTVEEAESRFHELMTLLGQQPAPDSATIAEAVTALEAQLAQVLEEAEAAEVPLNPRAAAGSAGG